MSNLVENQPLCPTSNCQHQSTKSLTGQACKYKNGSKDFNDLLRPIPTTDGPSNLKKHCNCPTQYLLRKKVQSAKKKLLLKIYLSIRFNKHFPHMYFMLGLVKEIYVVNCACALHASFYLKALGRTFFVKKHICVYLEILEL